MTIIGETVVLRRAGWTEIALPLDEVGVPISVPDDSGDAAQMATAEKLGLSVVEMNAGHDLTHCLLANWIGLPYSPTLGSVSGGPFCSTEINDAEEAAVLAIQRYMGLMGIRPHSLTKWNVVA